MRKEQAPAFQFYVKDWRSSRKVQQMSFAQRGMYLEMLLEEWDAGSVPSTPAELAAAIGGTAAEWAKNWNAIRQCFVPYKMRNQHTGGNGQAHGRLVNVKLERIRSDLRRYRKALSDSGLRGAEKRWGRHSQAIGSPSKANGQK
jgi:uncharacterized protein YdaU (DUF1376 family)